MSCLVSSRPFLSRLVSSCTLFFRLSVCCPFGRVLLFACCLLVVCVLFVVCLLFGCCVVVVCLSSSLTRDAEACARRTQTLLELQHLALADGEARPTYNVRGPSSVALLGAASFQLTEVTRTRFTSPCHFEARHHQQRCLRRSLSALHPMLVSWLRFLTPSCCHSLSFTNSACNRFSCPLIVSIHLLSTDLIEDPASSKPASSSLSCSISVSSLASNCPEEVAVLLPGLQLLRGDRLLFRQLP